MCISFTCYCFWSIYSNENGEMKTVLIYINRSSFVARDIEILKATEYHFDNKKTWILMSFLKQVVHFALNRYENYVIWFGDYHALIPILFSRLYRKKSYIIVGGFDAMSLPELNYGLFRKNNLRQLLVRIAYKLCTKILPVDDSLEHSLRSFIKLPDKFITIHQGIDLTKWKPALEERIIDFITVGNINEESYYRKGIDRFVKMSNQMPDKKFMIIGWGLILQGCPRFSNLTVLGFQGLDEVKKWMNRSKVYCQFSLAEGIPNALIEAMAMGCVPCVTPVNGMPWVVGDSGVVLRKSMNTERWMRAALNINNKKALERVKIVDINSRKESFKQLGI